MRIVYTLNSAKPGGMEKHVAELVQGMVQFGHQVYVICPGGELSKWYSSLGAQVKELAINSEIDLNYILKVITYFKQIKPDVVHSHELKSVVNTLIAAHLAGIKIKVSHTHTPISEWKVSDLKKFVNKIINTLVVNLFSTKEIALTNSVKNIKMSEGIINSKLEVLSNGIDLSLFEIDEHMKELYRSEIFSKYSIKKDSFVLGNISRLSEEKGHFVLLEAFKNIALSNKNMTLLLCGGGVLESKIRSFVSENGFQDQVTITGLFDESEKIKLLCAFDLLVFPSLAEGFGYVPIEAMSLGIPVLASDLPVIKEVCAENVSYFLTGDSESLENRIQEKLLKMKSLDSKMQAELKKAKLFVKENYSIEMFWEKYNNLYLKLYENTVSK